MVGSDQPVLILTTWNDSEAELVRQILASYGISCSVSSEVPHSVLPLSVDGLGAIRLHVPAAAAAAARRILAAHQDGAAGAGATAGDEGGSRSDTGSSAAGVVVPMPVTIRAATRIDLAGGTLDIWPLYLFLDDPVTVNLAIDLHALAEVTVLPGTRVVLISDDLRHSTAADSPLELPVGGPLELAARLVRHLAPEGGVRLRTAASVPAGSGLGGSSALAVAMSLALARRPASVARVPLSAAPLARLLSDLEAQVLGIPTGVQDYYPALLGGCLRLEFRPGGVDARPLRVPLEQLEQRLVLVFEGASRSSGLSNLDMVQRFLGGERSAREGLAAVAAAAHQLAAALEQNDLDAAGEAMDAEMTARRRLSPKVMTPATERLFSAARKAGALGAKVCGAGGGGCSVFWARQGGREALAQALEAAGGRVLPFRTSTQGALAAAGA